jgi:hypothetical protein
MKKTGYILLTNTGSFLTKLIKLYTKKRYNHASIAFDSNLIEVYSFGRKTAGNPFIGGFVRENVRTGLFQDADCALYSFTVTEKQMHNMKTFIQKIEDNKEQYRYNFLGLFGFILNKAIKRKNTFFCSQFVAAVLMESKTIYLDRPISLIAPADMQNIPTFQLIYEGKLKDYLPEYETELLPFHYRFQHLYSKFKLE